jgi:hypothetical protein
MDDHQRQWEVGVEEPPRKISIQISPNTCPLASEVNTFFFSTCEDVEFPPQEKSICPQEA